MLKTPGRKEQASYGRLLWRVGASVRRLLCPDGDFQSPAIYFANVKVPSHFHVYARAKVRTVEESVIVSPACSLSLPNSTAGSFAMATVCTSWLRPERSTTWIMGPPPVWVGISR